MKAISESQSAPFTVHTREPFVSAKNVAITAFAVAVICGGLVGVAYATVGLTPLSQSSRIFLGLGSRELITILVVGSTAAGFGGILICVACNRQEQFRPIDSEGLSTFNDPVALDDLTKAIGDDNPHLAPIRKFVTSGYSDFLEYYGFYHHLASITEDVLAHPEKRADWEAFLQKIDGVEVLRRDGNSKVTVDCHIEFLRLKGKKIQFTELEELKRDSLTIQKDLTEAYALCLDAFPNWGEDDALTYFFKSNNRPCVLRDQKTREILAIIVFQDFIFDGKKVLFFHTLARKANTIKMKITEKVLKRVPYDDYAYVYCNVLKNNLPAQKVYLKLGFRNEGPADQISYFFVKRPKK